MKADLGVIIARFQAPTLTEAHRYLISQVATRSHRIAILLGIPPVSGTKRNPLEYVLRERMVSDYMREYHSEKDFTVLPLLDCEHNQEWATRADALIDAINIGHTTTLYCGPDGAGPVYTQASGKYPVTVIDTLGVHATDIRSSILPRYTEDFRAGVIYACEKRYRALHSTVDILVTRPKGDCLLGQKKSDHGKWRLVGGFTESTDESHLEAARRELQEETGISLPAYSFKFVNSQIIHDWRYRGSLEKIMTNLFIATLPTDEWDPRNKASDDLDKISWFPVDKVQEIIHPIHSGILNDALRMLPRPPKDWDDKTI